MLHAGSPHFLCTARPPFLCTMQIHTQYTNKPYPFLSSRNQKFHSDLNFQSVLAGITQHGYRWALLNVCTVLDETNGSSFRPVSVLAFVAICGVNQYIGDNFLSLLPSLLLALNLEKKKKIYRGKYAFVQRSHHRDSYLHSFFETLSRRNLLKRRGL